MNYLKQIPLMWLAVAAIWLALAPILPEPHILEKLRMLREGTLSRPLDIFDLLMHSVPSLVLIWRLWDRARSRKSAS
ncbi:MAG: hypothetical protein RJA34_2259 [Pseudomonadota bacterium]|jgi:hypothetical protein